MKIGYACTPLGIPYKTTRRFILKNFNEENFIKTVKDNLKDFEKIINYNNENNIGLFRISSDIIPFGSYEGINMDWSTIFNNEFKYLSNLVKESNIRLSMHPGQYTLLNSPNDEIVKSSILDLEYHTKLLDSLNCDTSSKIILHIGGVYGDKESSITRFINNYKSLDPKIKNRLVIENDERSYSIDDLLNISSKCNIPIVFDNLHYECKENKEPDLYKILLKVKETWSDKDGNLKIHYSEQSPLKRKGSHSTFINLSKFIHNKESIDSLPFDVDIMTEVKDKDFSAIKLANYIQSKNAVSTEIKRYELFLRERGEDTYLKALDEGEKSLESLYKYIDSIYYNEVSEKNFKNGLKYAFKDLEPILNIKEKNHYQKYIKNKDFIKAKKYLINLVIKKKDLNYTYKYYFHDI